MSDGSGEWGPQPGPILPPGSDGGPSSAATPTRHGSHIIRPMPSGGVGESFEELTRRSVLRRAEDDSRFEAPEDPDGGDGSVRAVPVGSLMILVVSILILGVVGGVLWVNTFETKDASGDTTVKPTPGVTEELLTPQEVVRGYLKALTDGRVEDALAFGPPLTTEESTLLLKQSSVDAMPVTSRPSNVSVLTKDPLATNIRVAYTIYGEDVSTTMRVELQDNDSYLLERTTVTIQLQVVGSENLPVQLNGITIDPRLAFAVLPGMYRPSTSLPLVAFLDAEPIKIPSLDYADTVIVPINPELTPAGQAGFEQAARTSLSRCMASTELAPTGCPNEILAPKPVKPGSVKWELQKPESVWESFNPTLSPADQTMATATLSMQVSVTMEYADGLNRGNKDISINVAVSATMAGDDPAALTVVWGA